MKLYFSGLGGAPKYIIEHVLKLPTSRALASYAMPKQFQRLKDFGIKSIFIDSGAWSAFNSGVDIDIDSFIDFGKEIQDEVDAIANLDVIEDAYGSLKNFKYITKRGLDVWPVYHFGEPKKLLQDYMKETDHICIGGLVGTGVKPSRIRRNLMLFYAEYPLAKVHTFGVNSFDVLMGLPIYSTDALTWRSGSRFGDAFINGRRHKVGRTSGQRTHNYYEAIAHLKKEGLDVEDPEFKWSDLDLYNIDTLYEYIEVWHPNSLSEQLVVPEELF
jgi:hypothetical protein